MIYTLHWTTLSLQHGSGLLRVAKATIAKYDLQIGSRTRIEQINKILMGIKGILTKARLDTVTRSKFLGSKDKKELLVCRQVV